MKCFECKMEDFHKMSCDSERAMQEYFGVLSNLHYFTDEMLDKLSLEVYAVQHTRSMTNEECP